MPFCGHYLDYPSALSWTHWGRDKMTAILYTSFSNTFSWMRTFESQIKFHWNMFHMFLLQEYFHWYFTLFLAATKQLYKWYFPSVRPSVCLSVRPSHLFDYVPIIVSSWNFQESLPVTEVTSMQKVKVRGQRSQRSQPNFTVSGL